MSEPCKISVTLGSFDTTLHLYRTAAPKNYDGFGTFTLAEYDEATKFDDEGKMIVKPMRFILIQNANLEWQVCRNRSGLQFTEPVDDSEVPVSVVRDKLFARLCGKED